MQNWDRQKYTWVRCTQLHAVSHSHNQDTLFLSNNQMRIKIMSHTKQNWIKSGDRSIERLLSSVYKFLFVPVSLRPKGYKFLFLMGPAQATAANSI